MSDERCKYCNWLNKEVVSEYVCKNCGKKNVIETFSKTTKDIYKSEKEVKNNGV